MLGWNIALMAEDRLHRGINHTPAPRCLPACRLKGGIRVTSPVAQIVALPRLFFAWWFGELSSLLPARLREQSARRDRLVLRLEGIEAALSMETARGIGELGRLNARDKPAASEADRGI